MRERVYILQVIVGFLATISINCDDISSSVQVNPAYDELFADAMRFYNKEDWENALAKFNEAIEDWQNERKYTIECQQKCKNDFKTRTESYSIEYFRYLSFKRNCTSACMLGKMGNRLEVSKHVRRRFDDRIPYSYMQYAYHKHGNNRMAVQAASTYLRLNPTDEQMKDNMKYYGGLPELQDIVIDDIESLAPIEHHELYEKGRRAYNAKDWEKSVEYFEESIKEYTRAYNECKCLCEVEVDDRQQYIRGGIYGYHMQLLLCTLDCPRKLSMMFNYPQAGYISKQYDFLHFSYIQLGRQDDALPCAVTTVMLNPLNDRVRSNLEYYEGKGIATDQIAPREEAKYFYEDIKSQMELLFEVKAYLLDLDEEYKGTEDLADTTYETFQKTGQYPDETPPSNAEEDQSKNEEEFKDEPYKRFPSPAKETIEKFLQEDERFQDAKLTMFEGELNGTYRVVFDGLASEDECKKLAELGMTLGHAGDGYKNNPSPHTKKEEFLGVNVNNATWAAAKGDTSLEKAELYMNLSEKARIITEAYFRLSTPLYFSYTHLVCRKARSEQPSKGIHISHPIHSDNCVLKHNGENVTCRKEHPAYTWRDYSAILYLNDDFAGGQFVFAGKNQTIEAIVKPRCGRMVAFSAGFENLHGVLGIKQGIRCALPIWFTLDKRYDEKQRYDAAKILDNLRKEANTQKKLTEDHKEL